MGIDSDVEMTTLEQEGRALLGQLDDARAEFLAASAAFLAAWYWETVVALVGDQAAVTHQLGPERLARLKAEVRALQAGAHIVVEETLGADAIWWHRKPKDQWYAAAPGQLPNWLTDCLERATARLGDLTRPYGYSEGRGTRYRLNGVTFPDAMVVGVNRYAALKREAEQVRRRLEARKRARRNDSIDS
jgi:hypothetical protein